MMKVIKNPVFTFILGAIIFSSITTLALTIASKDVSYDNTQSGSEKETVQDAIDDLYERVGNEPQLKTVEIYTGNSQADRTIDVKAILPDKYSELTIDNFYFSNVRVNTSGTGMAGSNGNAFVYDILGSYDPSTGILKTNKRGMIYNSSGHNIFTTYTIVAIYVE